MIDGFININKHAGITSAHIVGRIKRLLRQKLGLPPKIGHMGTLDPMAEGVLLVAVGRATKCFDALLAKEKTYISTFRFGVLTDTLDREGSVVSECGKLPEKEEILQVLPSLCGVIDQKAPDYSAKKIGGKKAYELARKNIEFEAPTKKVFIHSIELIEKISDSDFSFKIVCGGGTYIRSIARDMAEKLGTVGIMQSLVRTKVGGFSIENSLTFEEFEKKVENGGQFLLPQEFALS